MSQSGRIRWVKMVKAATKLPVWETEWAIDRGRSEYHSAIFDCRRLTMALWLGVKHTFIYDFCDSDTGQSVTDYHQRPRQSYFVIDRVFSVLTPDLVADKHTVGATSSDPAFDFNNFTAFTFESANPTYPYKSCAVVWFGHIVPGGSIGTPGNSIRKAELTVYHPSADMVIATDFLSGTTWRPFMDSARKQRRYPQRTDFHEHSRVRDSITGWYWSLRSYAHVRLRAR
jgi:hypothetical protein